MRAKLLAALTAGALVVGAAEWSELCDIARCTWGGPYPGRVLESAGVPLARVAPVDAVLAPALDASAPIVVPMTTVARAD